MNGSGSKRGRGSSVGTALFAILALVGCTPAADPGVTSPPARGAIDDLLREAVDQGVVRGVVAMVADSDEILYEGAFGLQDVAADIQMRRDSIFRMMSMTKPIASVAAMMLYQDGVFDLDDPIADHLPGESQRHVIVEFNESDGSYTTAAPQPPPTIRQAFSHTSGAGYDFSSAILARLREITGEDPGGFPLLYHPGTRWNYSVSTDRLAELVETASQGSFDQFLAERIFEPLDMGDTSYVVPDEKRSRVATIHQREADGSLVETPNPQTLEGPARGRSGLFSTAPDYVRFLQMLLNDGLGPTGRLLAPETVSLMRQNHIGALTVSTQVGVDPRLSQPFPINAGTDKFGLGFQIASTDGPGLRSRGSYSWSGLYNTHFWVDPDRGLAGIVLTQLLPFYDARVMALCLEFETQVNRNLGR